MQPQKNIRYCKKTHTRTHTHTNQLHNLRYFSRNRNLPFFLVIFCEKRKFVKRLALFLLYLFFCFDFLFEPVAGTLEPSMEPFLGRAESHGPLFCGGTQNKNKNKR